MSEEQYQSNLKKLIKEVVTETLADHFTQENERWEEIKSTIELLKDFHGFARIGLYFVKLIIGIGALASAILGVFALKDYISR